MQVKETGGQNQVPSDSIADNELFLHLCLQHEAELHTACPKVNREDMMQAHIRNSQSTCGCRAMALQWKKKILLPLLVTTCHWAFVTARFLHPASGAQLQLVEAAAAATFYISKLDNFWELYCPAAFYLLSHHKNNGGTKQLSLADPIAITPLSLSFGSPAYVSLRATCAAGPVGTSCSIFFKWFQTDFLASFLFFLPFISNVICLILLFCFFPQQVISRFSDPF